MARYDLPQYQSMYRDPQSVAINTELRNRFVENFAADDQLTAAVDAMDSADFEGDLTRKKELTGEYNTILEQRASEGDYEYMGMAVARSARDFVKDYTPLKENKKAYDTWKTLVDKSHESYNTGKGGLNNDEYLKMLEKAKHGYTGLEYNEDGILNEDSYFKGQDFVRSVDEISELDQALKGIEPNSYENLGIETPLADLVQDQNGNIKLDKEVDTRTGEIIKYFVTNKNGTIEAVKPERVAELAKTVLNKPEIVSGMKQRVDLNTFKNIDATTASTAADQLQSEIENEISRIQNKPKLSDQDEADVTAYQEKLKQIQTDRENKGDLQFTKDYLYQQDYDAAVKWASGKFAYQRTRGGRTFKINPEYLKGKVRAAVDQIPDGLKIEHTATQYTNPVTEVQGENNVTKQQNYVENLKKTRDGEVKVFNNVLKEAGGTGNYTIKQIMNDFTIDTDGRLIDPEGNILAADEGTLKSIQNMLKVNLENESLANQLMIEAKNEVKYNQRIDKAVKNVTSEQINRGFHLPPFAGYEFGEDYKEALANNQVTDMVDFYKQLVNPTSPLHRHLATKYGYKETSTGSGLYYSEDRLGNRWIHGRRLVESGSPNIDYYNAVPESEKTWIDENGNKQKYYVNTGGTAVDDLLGEINREASGDKKRADKDLEKYLEDRKTSTVAHSSQRWPGKNKKESDKHKTMVTTFFKKRDVPESFAMKINGKFEDVPGGVEALGLKDAKVVGVDWVPDPVSGDIMYALTVKGKNQEDVTTSKTIYVDAGQVTYLVEEKTDFIKNAQNNPAFKIEHKINKAQHLYRLKGTTIDIQEKVDAEGTIVDYKYEYDFKDNKVKVFTLKANGNYQLYTTYEIGSPQYYEAVTNPNIRVK